jgi:mersacidin/lichenicidin family type 2 lantibiotic
MSEIDIVRAWRDEDYRLSLSDEDRAALPESPAGVIDLSDLDLEGAVGAASQHIQTLGCCGGLTTDAGFCSLVCSELCSVPCTRGPFCYV